MSRDPQIFKTRLQFAKRKAETCRARRLQEETELAELLLDAPLVRATLVRRRCTDVYVLIHEGSPVETMSDGSTRVVYCCREDVVAGASVRTRKHTKGAVFVVGSFVADRLSEISYREGAQSTWTMYDVFTQPRILRECETFGSVIVL